MEFRPTRHRVRWALALVVVGLAVPASLIRGQPKPDSKDIAKPAARGKQAWTMDEALAQLTVYPRDPYLQYVALQLARRENRLGTAGDEVARVVNADTAPDQRAEARARAD